MLFLVNKYSNMNKLSIKCCHLTKCNDVFLIIAPNKNERKQFSKYLNNSFHFHIRNENTFLLSTTTAMRLHAIIILQSETSDYIEITSNKQALSALLTECEVDIRDKACVQKSCILISHLISQVPVITLHYNTIENSANLLFNYLHTKKIPD